MTLLAAGVLFLPLVFGACGALSVGAARHGRRRRGDSQHKSPYLNVSFFLIRAAVYFAIWIALALCAERGCSARRTDRRTIGRAAGSRGSAGPGLCLLS